MKSLVVFLILGIFAYMTLRGFIGPARIWLEDLTIIDLKGKGFSSQAVPELLSGIFDIDSFDMTKIVTGLIVFVLFVFCLKDRGFRCSYKDLFSGTIIGILIPLAWYATGVIGKDDFDPTPLVSFSFVAPSGNAIQYLMTFTGSTINFGIAAVGGIILGSFFMSKLSGEFRLESFTSTEDFLRHIFGAALMGVGGIMALGCTIGQGVSGISTLALGSFLALAAIIIGGILGLKYLEEGSLIGAFKNLLKYE